MNIRDPHGDGEAKAGTFHLASGGVSAIGPLEDMRPVGRQDPNATVLNGERRFIGVGSQSDSGCARRGRVLSDAPRAAVVEHFPTRGPGRIAAARERSKTFP